MQTLTLVVAPDGRVKIPGTQPGQLVTNHVQPETAAATAARPRSPAEQERIVREQMEDSGQARASIGPEQLAVALNHGEWLYGPDGLPW